VGVHGTPTQIYSGSLSKSFNDIMGTLSVFLESPNVVGVRPITQTNVNMHVRAKSSGIVDRIGTITSQEPIDQASDVVDEDDFVVV
jgi:hypothetical protein